jgi:hypothetical protein
LWSELLIFMLRCRTTLQPRGHGFESLQWMNKQRLGQTTQR